MPDSQLQTALAALLDFSGLTEVSEADSSQQGIMKRAFNKTIQDIAAYAPASWWGSDQFGESLPAPATTTGTVTDGAKTLNSLSASTFDNQIALVGDDPIGNRIVIVQDTRSLMFPYSGSSGSKSISVRYDTVLLPADFRRFRGRLEIIGHNDPVSVVGSGSGPKDQNGVPSVAIPTQGRIIAREIKDGGRRSHLRFDSTTPEALRLTGEYFRRPPNITALTGSRNDLCPEGYIESVFVPFLLKAYIECGGVAANPAAAPSTKDAVMTLESADDAGGDDPPRTESGIFDRP